MFQNFDYTLKSKHSNSLVPKMMGSSCCLVSGVAAVTGSAPLERGIPSLYLNNRPHTEGTRSYATRNGAVSCQNFQLLISKWHRLHTKLSRALPLPTPCSPLPGLFLDEFDKGWVPKTSGRQCSSLSDTQLVTKCYLKYL